MGYTEKGGSYYKGRDVAIHEEIAADPHPQYSASVHTHDYAASDHTHADTGVIAVVFDAPAAEDQIDIVVPFACTITGVTLLADISGSIVIDIWKDTLANFPPTDADTITDSAPPTITSDTDSQDTTLTGWTTALAAGDILRFNVDSVTDITRVTLSLAVAK